MATFEVKGEKFYLNGREFPVFSGAIHYFRCRADCGAIDS